MSRLSSVLALAMLSYDTDDSSPAKKVYKICQQPIKTKINKIKENKRIFYMTQKLLRLPHCSLRNRLKCPCASKTVFYYMI